MLYNEIIKLKNLIRKGWQMRLASEEHNGTRLESDAEHTFSMQLLAIEIMDKLNLNLDEAKVIKMCLIHELCEIDFGDHTPLDDITKEEKHNGELKCIERLSKENNMPWLLDLWCEFEDGQTPEAKFVKDMDKLDAILQSKEYSERFNKPELFEEFRTYSKTIYDRYELVLQDSQIENSK